MCFNMHLCVFVNYIFFFILLFSLITQAVTEVFSCLLSFINKLYSYFNNFYFFAVANSTFCQKISIFMNLLLNVEYDIELEILDLMFRDITRRLFDNATIDIRRIEIIF